MIALLIVNPTGGKINRVLRRVLRRRRECDTKIGHARCEQPDPQPALDCAFVETTVLHDDRQAITARAEDRNFFERVAIHKQ